MRGVIVFVALGLGACGGEEFTNAGSGGGGGGSGGSAGVAGSGGNAGGLGGAGGSSGSGGAGAVGGAGGGAGSGGSGGSGGGGCAGVDLNTDGSNCGQCGHSCLGSACAAGECVGKVLVTGVQPKGLAVEGGKLYFADEMAGAIRVMPADGSAAPTTFAAGQPSPRYLCIAGGKVYWTKADGTVMMQPTGGTTATAVASGLSKPLGIGVAGPSAYVAETNTGYLLQLPLAGGSKVTLAAMNVGQFIEGLATDGQKIWVAYNLGSGIAELTMTGGSETPFVTGQGGPSGVAVDATWVYWANQQSGEIRKKTKDGTATVTLKTGVAHAVGVAVDAKFVYVSEGNAQRIFRVAK